MGWIGVDLDETLALYEEGMASRAEVGTPIPQMVKRVKRWLAKGYEVKIFTARVNKSPGWDVQRQKRAIEAWCLKHLGQKLDITNEKTFHTIEIWDDRAVRVEGGTGRKLSPSKKLRDLEEWLTKPR